MSPPSATVPPPLQPVPGRPRHDHCGAAARASRGLSWQLPLPCPRQKPVLQLAPSMAPSSTSPSLPLLPPRLIPSSSPSSERRQVMPVGRLHMPSFSSLILDVPTCPSSTSVTASNYFKTWEEDGIIVPQHHDLHPPPRDHLRALSPTTLTSTLTPNWRTGREGGRLTRTRGSTIHPEEGKRWALVSILSSEQFRVIPV